MDDFGFCFCFCMRLCAEEDEDEAIMCIQKLYLQLEMEMEGESQAQATYGRITMDSHRLTQAMAPALRLPCLLLHLPVLATSAVSHLKIQAQAAAAAFSSLQVQQRWYRCAQSNPDVEQKATAKGKGKGSNSQMRHPKHKALDHTSKLLLAGAVSTAVSRTFVAPLERLKLEYVVRGAKDNWFKTMHVIWSSEGFSGFWRGNALNLFRMVPFKTINFVAYEMYCSWISSMPGKGEIANHDRLIAGAVSGVAATILCLPLDTIRTRLVAPGGESFGGVGGCFQHMLCNEGFLAFYKGLMPTLLSMAPSAAVFYGVYDMLKASYLKSRNLKHLKTQSTSKAPATTEEFVENSSQLEIGPIRTLLYGAIAGACAETVTYPLEVVRRHLQLQVGNKLSLIDTLNSMVKTDGATALFAGVIPSTMQVLPSAALSYLIYESMKAVLKIS